MLSSARRASPLYVYNLNTLVTPQIVELVAYWQEKLPFALRGTGPTIQQFYEEKGGPEAYLGTVFPQFPNFYMISGKFFFLLLHYHVYTNGFIV